MKKFLSLLFAVIIMAFALSSCSLTIKNLGGGDDTETDTSSGDTNSGGIIPGENELPALPLATAPK